ncbi:22078_t:CDS:2, partial [Gigaspora margarita]
CPNLGFPVRKDRTDRKVVLGVKDIMTILTIKTYRSLLSEKSIRPAMIETPFYNVVLGFIVSIQNELMILVVGWLMTSKSGALNISNVD